MSDLITLTGPSGCGKSTIIRNFMELAGNAFRPEVIQRFTTRPTRADDGTEMISVSQIPTTCDVVYEQYGVRYGLCLRSVFDALSRGKSPIVIINDVRSVADVRVKFGGLARSVFVFREGPTLKQYQQLAAARGVKGDSDAQKRFRKAEAIYRIYIENIELFDHVILNCGTLGDLRRQVSSLVGGLERDLNWPLKEISGV